MTEISLSRLMQATTRALYDCQQSLDQSGPAKRTKQSINADQAESLLKLMETLVDTKNELAKEISSDRFSYIDPKIVNEMKKAIEMVISNPIDAKVNKVYFSIFGYNSTLWHVLNEMQKLLKTAKLLKKPLEKKVAKVNKGPFVKRKKRHEMAAGEDEKEEK